MPRTSKRSTRRGNKEGSIYQRKDGKWCGQVLIGYKADGKPERKTFYGNSREEVAAKVSEATNQAFKGIVFVKSAKTTVGEFVHRWLFDFKRSEVTSRTFEWYHNIIKAHILPAFGTIPLIKLSAYEIQSLLNTKLKNSSPRTAKAVRDVLNQAMKHAAEMKLIGKNPVDGTKLPKHNREIHQEKVKAIPVNLRKQLLEALETEPIMKPILFTLLFTGMRIGELLALVWKNVDLSNGIITVDRALTLNPKFDDNGNCESRGSVVSATKTESGNRKIKIPAHVVNALQDWKNQLARKNISLILDEAVVFSNQNGNIRTYNGFRTTYRRFLEKHGLDGDELNLHRYRHTFATMLLETGVNPRIVQKLMGHKDIETTLGIYSHVLPEVYDGVAETLDDIYSQTVAGKYAPSVGNSRKQAI